MTEFQNALARFLQGQLDLAGLEAIVLQLLSREPARADEIVQTLDQLFRSSRLSAKDYIALKQAISDAPPAAAPAARAASPAACRARTATTADAGPANPDNETGAAVSTAGIDTVLI